MLWRVGEETWVLEGYMETEHRVCYCDARNISCLAENSIDLVVTSPPYPMIEMWDDLFSRLHPAIRDCLQQGNDRLAFDSMHTELKKVWTELFRVMKPGAYACINIGDATRTVNGKFQLFPNHARIMQHFLEIGFDALPLVLWRKQTNAPNKFMGSGMLPAGAYVTLEHEYILVFRKGGKRVFSAESEKHNRRESAVFWEERNVWFSDLWDFKGVRQNTGKSDKHLRQRSAAYPFALPFRLINMYSVMGDTVLDPFLGTGTTLLAAMASGRNSIGLEIDPSFSSMISHTIGNELLTFNRINVQRIQDHLAFVGQCVQENKPLKHYNAFYGFPVMTQQETMLKLPLMRGVYKTSDNVYKVEHRLDQSINKLTDMKKPSPGATAAHSNEGQLTIDF